MKTESEKFDLQSYMTKGVERVVTDAVKATLKNPRESAFMLKFAAASKAASKKRKLSEDSGEHIPPFLIASITSSCNLHCAGCYSRGIDSCCDEKPRDQLNAQEWNKVFLEAEDIGISFIFLAGGEPLIRRDVIEQAAAHPKILFPIVTNGTLLDKYIDILDKNRNLVPVISIEGGRVKTDARRGEGMYKVIEDRMDILNKKGIAFGASITVTKENLNEVYSEAFLKNLSERGCKLVIFIEYVPVEKGTEDLAPTDTERELMEQLILDRRQKFENMLMIEFPGSEKNYGGCLAAGRGFFHINSRGGAEPCPFSPYSDVNIRNMTLKEAMKSPLFKALQSGGILADDHDGGCVLYQKREQVEKLLKSEL
jgi:MoaA/NifB/PqqE/SkfB family radical SAM enzyme